MRALLRKTTAAGVVTAALVGVVAGALPADAQVRSMRAALGCRDGQVLVYPPDHRYTRSTYAQDRLESRSELYYWTGSAWKYAGGTGWWAYTYTDRYGYPSPPVAYNGGLSWASTSSGQPVMFRPVNATRGYAWKVKTFVRDQADGTTAWVWAVLDNTGSTSNSTGDYCRT